MKVEFNLHVFSSGDYIINAFNILKLIQLFYSVLHKIVSPHPPRWAVKTFWRGLAQTTSLKWRQNNALRASRDDDVTLPTNVST